MNISAKVIKNFSWLVIQPLILNFISIYAIGYIARTLGNTEYGIFIFSFSLIALLTPLSNFGIRAITVRTIATDKSCAPTFIGKVLINRLILTSFSIISIILFVKLGHYPPLTCHVVYIGSVNVLLIALSTSIHDVFQAFEKMKYISYSRLIGGVSLTILSIITMYFKLGIKVLALVYITGTFIELIVSIIILLTKFFKPKFSFEFSFLKMCLQKGFPFFLPGIVFVLGNKMSILIISKLCNEQQIGIYGAANTLIEKLLIIPDGMCTAIFPTLSALYVVSKIKAEKLFSSFFKVVLIISIPLTIGISLLSKQAILLIYGNEYLFSAKILSILSWWLFFTFIGSMFSWQLNANHLEKKSAIAKYISIPFGLLLNIILIKIYGIIGAAYAMVATSILDFLLLANFSLPHFEVAIVEIKFILKLFLTTFIMAIVLFLLPQYIHILIRVLIAVFVFSVVSIISKLITISNIIELIRLKKGMS
jgi:O-antigen/teichoic acid export membrane protein